MNIIKNFIAILILSLFTLNNSIAANVTGRPTVYINTVHAMQLCETGSTLANCLNPVTIGESEAGRDMDLGVVGSTADFGNAGLIPSGKTYTHGQVIMSRSFTIAGSIATGAATCNTGGAAGVATAGGATNSQVILNQVLVAGDGTGNGDTMNSTSAVIDGTDAVAGTLTNGHGFMKFRWLLSKPLNVTFGKIPTMTIAFDLSNALHFSDGGNGACDGNDFYPGKPVVTNTFE
tara:strand:+ start:1009 stop:1707 length:699 start_codon:yes stop_codon:yes gene_type:complete